MQQICLASPGITSGRCPWLLQDLFCFKQLFAAYARTIKLPSTETRRDVVLAAKTAKVNFFATHVYDNQDIELVQIQNPKNNDSLHHIDVVCNNKFVLNAMVNGLHALIQASLKDVPNRCTHDQEGKSLIFRRTIKPERYSNRGLPMFLKNEHRQVFFKICNLERNVVCKWCPRRNMVVIHGIDTSAVLRTQLKVKEHIENSQQTKTYTKKVTKKKINTIHVTKDNKYVFDFNNPYTILQKYGFGKYLS